MSFSNGFAAGDTSNAFFHHPFQYELETLDDTSLRQVVEVANEDVEMQDLPSQTIMCLVIDTNIMLHYLDVLQQFVVGVERLSLPVRIIVPGIVVSELDKQKNRPDLQWLARQASTWLLEEVRKRTTVKAQAHEETCKRSGRWNVREPGEIIENPSEINDNLILDCCRYFATQRLPGKTVLGALCSGDKQLCIKTESIELRTVSPPPRSSQPWSSRDLAAKLFYDLPVNVTAFDGYPSKPLRDSAKAGLALSNARASRAASRVPGNDDAMDVDDTGDGASYSYQPSHPLDVLHLEIIDHFTPQLQKLVDRVGGSDVSRGKCGNGISQSLYAPEWTRIPLEDWTAKDCIEYLDAKKKGLGLGAAKLPQFLTRPYTKKAAYRIGHEWTRQEWVTALEALQRVGESWREENMLESMKSLRVHATATFGLRMRPTGT